MIERLRELGRGASAGEHLNRDDGRFLAAVEMGPALFEMLALAGAIREARRGRKADLCAIVSAKTGACTEDCAYCAQSSASRAVIATHALMDEGMVIERAHAARASGARRFSIVISGARPTPDEFRCILRMIGAIRDMGLSPCASLGMLPVAEMIELKNAGLHRYHHNIETSPTYFSRICSTHTYQDKLRTIDAVHQAGLSLCSGGIVGMGESWADRVEMALEARRLRADSVPINFLHPIGGTPLGDRPPLEPFEALKVVSLFRFLIPDAEVRLAGGRLQSLGEFNSMVFLAGADGLITGDYLTTSGRNPEDDIKLARAYGLDY